jgi:hypothetical protein
MKASQLRIGDWIMITGVPGTGVPNYYIHRDTKRVFEKLVARNRPVRIREIDEFGAPWYMCRFKKPDGTYEAHFLAISDSEDNWVPVNRRSRKVSQRAAPRKRPG